MLSPRLHIDFETQSACNLQAAGAFRYAEDPTTRATRLQFLFEGSDAHLWKADKPFPREVAYHVAEDRTVVQHNGGFERRVWNKTLSRQVRGLPEMRAEQQSCTLARALVIGLPRDLETLAKVLGCRNQKLDIDPRIFRKATVLQPDGTAAPLTEDETSIFDRYAMLDVLCEAEIDSILPELSERERQVWLMDQRINDRGIPVDIPSIVAAQALSDHAIKLADAEMRELTKGAVSKVTEASRLTQFLRGRGYDPNGVKEAELNLIDWSEDPVAQRAVELRLAYGKSSIKKLPRMLGCIASDGRLHDQYGYSVAATRRWAAQIVQFQNLPKYDEVRDKARLEALYALFERFGTDAANVSAGMRLITPEPLIDTVSRALRKLIKASPGNKLIGGDLKNIEGRANAWLAGQEDKLEAFRAFDRGEGPDLYAVAYATAFGVALDSVTKPLRQIGKVQELAGGYQGGVRAFCNMAELLGFNLGELAASVRKAADPVDWADMASRYLSARDKHGLPEEVWTGIKILVRNFRRANDKIVRGWYARQDAIIQAIENPGLLTEPKGVRGIKYLVSDGFLWTSLPSGGLLGYYQPEIILKCRDSLRWPDGLVEDTDGYFPHEIADFVRLGLAELIEGRPQKTVQFWGKVKGTWAQKYLYGGLACENDTQAMCRDIQADKMLACEASDFPVICHTHDDTVCEIAAWRQDSGDFKKILNAPIQWAPGLPIAADCWEGLRYGG